MGVAIEVLVDDDCEALDLIPGLLLLAIVLATTATFRRAGFCLVLLRASVDSSKTASPVPLECRGIDELISLVWKRVLLLERSEGFAIASGSLERGPWRWVLIECGSLADKWAIGGDASFAFFNTGGGRGGSCFLLDEGDSVSVSSASLTSPSS